MTNRLFSILRHTAIVALVAGLFVVSGCDDDPTGPTLNIKDLLADPQFSQASTNDPTTALDTLNYYVNLYPDLVALLSSTDPNYTFFAPSNAAFASLKATPGFPTAPNAIKLINPALIAGVLSYHFVEGKKFKADLTAGLIMDTEFTDPLAPSAAQQITVNATGTLKASPLAANVDIDIVSENHEATNGVIHIIESVMIPPSTGTVLIPILGKVAGTIMLSKDFTNLAKVIMFADQAFTENAPNLQFRVITWLAMPITGASATANLKGITFFAPPNTAGSTPIFTETAANTIIGLGAEAARGFLMNHLVVVRPGGTQTIGQFIVGTPPTNNPNEVTKFAIGQQIKPYNGEAKRIFVNIVAVGPTTPTGVVVSNAPNEAGTSAPPAASFKPILLGDLPASNGYVQVLGGALQ